MIIQTAHLPTVALAALLLFAGFRLYYMACRLFLQSERWYYTSKQVGPVMEGVGWFLFALWSVAYLFTNPTVAHIAILLLWGAAFLGVVWFVVRDFMAGVFLRIEGGFALNERVKVQGVKGIVTHVGYLGVELETDEGQTVRIPYTKIQNTVRFKDNPAKRIKAHQFELMLPKIAPVDALIERQRLLLHTTPWSSVTKSPQIKYLRESASAYHFNIVIYTLQVSYFQKVKAHLLLHNKGAQILETATSAEPTLKQD